jgi:hypothetical protein
LLAHHCSLGKLFQYQKSEDPDSTILVEKVVAVWLDGFPFSSLSKCLGGGAMKTAAGGRSPTTDRVSVIVCDLTVHAVLDNRSCHVSSEYRECSTGPAFFKGSEGSVGHAGLIHDSLIAGAPSNLPENC